MGGEDRFAKLSGGRVAADAMKCVCTKSHVQGGGGVRMFGLPAESTLSGFTSFWQGLDMASIVMLSCY